MRKNICIDAHLYKDSVNTWVFEAWKLIQNRAQFRVSKLSQQKHDSMKEHNIFFCKFTKTKISIIYHLETYQVRYCIP